MVAILVVLTIVGFLLVDWMVQLNQARRAKLQLAEAGFGREPVLADAYERDPYLPPRGLFFHKGHCWAQIEAEGTCRVGMDGMIGRLIGRVDAITLPAVGAEVREGDVIAWIRQGDRVLALRAPVDGTVAEINDRLKPRLLKSKPYSDGWLLMIRPKALSEDARKLVVGDEVVNWHARESQRIADFFASLPRLTRRLVYDSHTGAPMLNSVMEKVGDSDWKRFQETFLEGRS